jgi:glycosyltransferase involved in cell wall biosynthesis
MSTITWLVSGLGVLGSIVWVGHLIHMARNRDRAVFLDDLPADPPAGGWPTLAVVFAARDEADAVGAATRSMLALDYPALELIAVDDRSADATGAILDELARRDDRLRVVHVRHLSPGWLGKTHALQKASEATGARWVLFTDADVVFEPSSLRKAVAFAESERLDHVTVGPEIPTESPGERIFLMMFGLLFALNAPLGRLEDPGSRVHAGIGAFNLVRAEALRAIGGFEHLKLSVDDDMRLARALKYAGYRTRLLLGRGSVSVRWNVGLGGLIRGLEKNFFAVTGFRIDKAFGGAAVIVILGVMPYLGLFVGTWWARIACGIGVASITAMAGALTKQSGIGWYYAALIPLAAIFTLIAFVRSVALTLYRGGVQWRGHLYPLEELKDHIRRRDAWMREVWRSTR